MDNEFLPFPNITVESILYITEDIENYNSNNKNINCYDDAKKVFLRAQGRLEQAKKFFVLDGEIIFHVFPTLIITAILILAIL